MAGMLEILDMYAVLCRYCDSFFESVVRMYPGEIRCAKGCSACCELHSVCALEARALASYLALRGRRERQRRRRTGGCALLVKEECSAYPARPLICRTHGIALFADSRNAVYSSCRLNFGTIVPVSLPRSRVFDTARITANLVRLNMAFCMASGEPGLAEVRFTIEQVREGAIPESILSGQP